ncbi:hypothetical protein DSM19430T_16830 [Desulfovibrio psychrotolerans]|uniref:Uncharacterized protein n=1 Tax=Desulfovibrio psychrotolerans TaxID=415242 RepID=A0A7J0BTF8_9BACT|nr:hypothetical protein DSM19430T_16830 [Desulfovibrio psychrotolerans]
MKRVKRVKRLARGVLFQRIRGVRRTRNFRRQWLRCCGCAGGRRNCDDLSDFRRFRGAACAAVQSGKQ